MEWTPEIVKFALDDVVYQTYRKTSDDPMQWPFNKPFYIILNLAVGGDWGALKGIDKDQFRGDGQIMEIDWVSIEQKDWPAPVPACCSGCGGGKDFCSPHSGTCYATKAKDYYAECRVAEEMSAPALPAPAVSVPPAPAPTSAPACCAGCSGGKNFCSTKSGTCYFSKAKDYYAECPARPPCEGEDCPMGWTPTSATSGAGQWCEVGRPADDWSALKTCPSVANSMKLKVMTYNLFWWNLFGQRGGEGGRAGRKIATTSGPEEYDFIGFQECDNIGWIMGDASKHGLTGEYGTLDGGRALGLAYRKSRWTLLDSGKEDVGEDSRKQWYGKRSAQWGRFQNKEGEVVFFVNHHGPLPVSESGGCAGSATAYNIMRMIAENAHKDDVVVLVGDFNAQAHWSRIQTLDRFMNRVYTGSSHGGVDHVFSNCAGSTVESTTNLGSGGSDHDALNVVFNIGQGPAEETPTPVSSAPVAAPAAAPPAAIESVPAAPASAPACCAGCSGGKNFCSTKSGTCYFSKAKDYYAECPAPPPCEGEDCPMSWTPTSVTSGAGQWCEVGRPADDWSALKSCPSVASSMKLKVMTYNLFWWNLFGQRGGEDGRAGRKIATTSGPEEYDFIGFQECDDIGRIMGDASKNGLTGEYGMLDGGRALGLAYRKSRWALLESGM